MNDSRIIEPVGTCPITGYPLVAVQDATGVHAGLALAFLDEDTRYRTPDMASPPRLRLEEVATPAEVFRSWTELLILAMNERILTAPAAVEIDNAQCRDLLHSRHHYDPARIIASVHIAAVEHLTHHQSGTPVPLILIPDVGTDHVRTATQTAVYRLAGTNEAIPDTVARLRRCYLQRLTVSA